MQLKAIYLNMSFLTKNLFNSLSSFYTLPSQRSVRSLLTISLATHRAFTHTFLKTMTMSLSRILKILSSLLARPLLFRLSLFLSIYATTRPSLSRSHRMRSLLNMLQTRSATLAKNMLTFFAFSLPTSLSVIKLLLFLR
jgi:hypothetical protein